MKSIYYLSRFFLSIFVYFCLMCTLGTVLLFFFSPIVRDFFSFDNPRGGVAIYDDVPIDEPIPAKVRGVRLLPSDYSLFL